MSFRPILPAILISITAFISSCGSEPIEEDMIGVPFTRNAEMDTCMVVIAENIKFNEWEKADAVVQEAREDHDIEVHQVYRGRIDPYLVISLNEIEDIKSAIEFVEADGLKPLEKPDSKIKTIYLQQSLEYTEDTKDTLVFYMSFKTMDYGRWEKAFLDDYRENPEHEFEVTHVFRGIEDPDHVHMIFLVNDPDYVEKMEKNNAFRMKMLAAGVASYPVTYKLSTVKAS